MTKGRSISNHQPHDRPEKSKRTAAGLTVQEFLDGWLWHVARTRRPTTAASYAGMVRRYVIPVIGPTALNDLRREHVDAVLSAARERLNPNTTRLLRAVLGIALHRAERWEIKGARNVVRLTDPPRVEPRELHFLRASEARRFLTVALGDRLAIVYVLALFCGLRRGEVLALRWRDVDLDKRELHVRNTLHEELGGTFRMGEAKSLSARRSISISVSVAAALQDHRVRQSEEPKEGRVVDGSLAWDLVVTSKGGRPLCKSTLRGNYRRLLAEAELPALRIHDLRHSCAALLLGEGVAAQTVASFLGHSEVKTTLDIYGHVARSQTREAALTLDRILGRESMNQETFSFAARTT
jgi:integrase